MTRFHYDDPLAAAWMARQHGMQFTRDAGDGDRLYIHPDSLHLLEPKEGDLVCFSFDLRDYKGCRSFITVKAEHVETGRFPLMPPDASKRIIQRNGIPFHWPHREE